MQETKAERGQIEIDLPDYREYWNSAAKKGYSGTAIFSKQEPLQVINGFPREFAKRYTFADELERDSAEEGRVITAEFDKFHVVTVYTPNAKDDLSRLNLRYKHWDPAFLAYCRELERSKPVILCGDLNVAHTELDLANPKPNRGKKGFTDEERKGFQNFIDAGFLDTFRLFTQGNGHYSWWSHFANSRARNVGWRIDYFLVSAKLREQRGERRDPCRCHGQRSLPGQHRADVMGGPAPNRAAWRGRPIEAVLFDLDGTLLDTAADITAALNRTLAESAWPAIAESEVRRMIGRGAPILLQRAAEAQGRSLDESAHAAMVERFFHHYGALQETNEFEAIPYPGARESPAHAARGGTSHGGRDQQAGAIRPRLARSAALERLGRLCGRRRQLRAPQTRPRSRCCSPASS